MNIEEADTVLQKLEIPFHQRKVALKKKRMYSSDVEVNEIVRAQGIQPRPSFDARYM